MLSTVCEHFKTGRPVAYKQHFYSKSVVHRHILTDFVKIL